MNCWTFTGDPGSASELGGRDRVPSWQEHSGNLAARDGRPAAHTCRGEGRKISAASDRVKKAAPDRHTEDVTAQAHQQEVPPKPDRRQGGCLPSRNSFA